MWKFYLLRINYGKNFNVLLRIENNYSVIIDKNSLFQILNEDTINFKIKEIPFISCNLSTNEEGYTISYKLSEFIYGLSEIYYDLEVYDVNDFIALMDSLRDNYLNYFSNLSSIKDKSKLYSDIYIKPLYSKLKDIQDNIHAVDMCYHFLQESKFSYGVYLVDYINYGKFYLKDSKYDILPIFFNDVKIGDKLKDLETLRKICDKSSFITIGNKFFTVDSLEDIHNSLESNYIPILKDGIYNL